MKGALAVLALALVPAAALAEDSAIRLNAVRANLRAEEARHAAAAAEAEAAEKEFAALQEQSVTLAATLQALEDEIAALGAEADRLKESLGKQEQELAATARAQEDVVASLVQLSRKPPAAALLHAGSAAEAARAAAVMDALLNEAAARSTALRQQVQQLRILQKQAADVQAERQTGMEALATRRDELTAALERKRALLATATAAEAAAAARVRDLAEQAQSLGDLVAGIDRGVPLPPPAVRKPEYTSEPQTATAPTAVPRSVASAGPPRRGAMSRPVTGRVLARFGQTGQFSNRSRGITWRTAPQAVVVAPWGGEVAYAGAFRGYGNIVILKHKGRYYSVIAGLSRIVVRPGQQLASGEPLGQMSKAASALDLYLELRRNETPIDPLPWLARARSG